MARTPVDITSLDLESLTDGQLRELVQHVKEAQRERFTSRLDELRLLAHEAGYEISRMGEGITPRRRRRTADTGDEDRRGVVLPKYQNPDHPSEQWSGRGRKPKWVEEKLNRGAKLEEFLITPPKAEAGGESPSA
jgi:DNA-binding protein H-NS